MNIEEFKHSRFAESHELINGEIYRTGFLGFKAGYFKNNLACLLSDFAGSLMAGIVVVSSGFEIDEKNVRGSQISYFKNMKVANLSNELSKIMPDLSVQFSYHDEPHEIYIERIAQFLNAGTALIWSVNVNEQNIVVYRLNRQPKILNENELLSGEDVLPNFRLPLKDFFALPHIAE